MKNTRGKRSGSMSMKESDQEGGQMNTALHELFLDELADLYNAEQQLTKALPKLAKAARSPELREAFQEHLEQTEEHISRLEEVAESLDEKLKGKKCKAMEGLIAEGKEIMEEQEDSAALDAGLIIAAQKVEHYEIASYGAVCAWAKQMGHDDALDLLTQTLDEEKETDQKLNEIAENLANQEAQQQED
jgi:ferritin-like metal-binding protein YciE